MERMSATVEEILDGLDDAQRAAATAVDGPVRIIAGAGAGKTRTVTRRIAYACATKAWNPRSTMAVTFSVKAAAEMRSRLSKLDVAADVKAATFHSAALHQLRQVWPDVCEGPMPFICGSWWSVRCVASPPSRWMTTPYATCRRKSTGAKSR